MSELITDPLVAKAALEIDMDAPCSRKEVATFVGNYFKANIAEVVKQQNTIATVLNLFMDYLTEKGLVNANSTRRFKLDTEEWNQYLKDRAAKNQKPN